MPTSLSGSFAFPATATRQAIPARSHGDGSDRSTSEAARALETAFLAEMLRAAGTAAARDGFGGGIGEDQFASFLAEAQAGALMQRGGLGLAEGIVRAMGQIPPATAR